MSMSVAISLKEQMKKKNKILIGIFLIVALLVVAGLSYFFVVTNFAKKNVENTIKNTMKSYVDDINYSIDNNLNILNILASLVHDNPDLATFENVSTLLSNIQTDHEFKAVSYLYKNASGYSYDYGTKTLVTSDFGNNQCVSQVLNSGNSCFNYNAETNMEEMVVPVNDSKGEIVGAIFGEKPADIFTLNFNKINSAYKVESFVVDSNGTVVSRIPNSNTPLVSTVEDLAYIGVNGYTDSFLTSAQQGNIDLKWVSNTPAENSVLAVSKLVFGNYTIILLFDNVILQKADFSTKFAGFNPLSNLNMQVDKSMLNNVLLIFVSIIGLLVVLYILVKIFKMISKKSAKTVMKLALYDEITDGFNKPKFFLEASQILLKANEDDKYVLILMDIINFKSVNQVYDTSKGNEVLKDVSESIKWFLEKNGISARIMSDYFAVLFKYKREEQIISFVNNLTRAIGEYKLNLKLVPRFGIFKVEDFTMPVETMVDRALMAKKLINTESKNNYAFFTQDLIDEIKKSKEIENEMYYALNQNQFVVYLQPQFDVLTNDVVGAEALVRWEHPAKGLLLPEKFLNLFEKNAFITYLDQYVIEQVCKLISKWINNGVEPVPVSVNVSSLDVSNPRFADMMKSMIDMYNVPAKFINFDISENVLFENSKYIKTCLADLKAYGFGLNVDNFGVPYSSVAMLNEFAFDNVKFDKKFIRDLIVTDRGKNILKDLKSLINSIYAKVVAVGVEEEKDFEFLKQAEFDYMHGYLKAKPMCIVEFETFVYKKKIGNNEENINE